jgi:hypothetical protein
MFLSLLKLFYYNSINIFKKNNIRNLSIFKNKKDNIYILGNGPSINDHIDDLITESYKNDLIVVNNFGSSKFYGTIKPAYYIILDPAYWSDEVLDEFKADRKLFKDISNKTNWNLKIIVPYVAYKKISSQFNGHKFISVYFYNHTIIPYDWYTNLVEKMYSNMFCTPRLQNVISASIFISITLGYKNVYLFGVDHSWLLDIIVDQENRVCWRENHFYNVANYRPHIKSNGEIYKLHELLFDYGEVFKSYHILSKFAYSQKCNILNCTKNSFIDAFKKI